ncbi:heterokaryon incompatibility, partial [Leptodontidium sp. 2 PMI_412]
MATPNLAEALKEIRKKKRREVLWVDAMCINQEDLKEKNQQLPLMRDIYLGAQMTVIWLGEGYEHS